MAISRKQEFYMSVKAILDRTQLRQDAKELQELLNKTEIDFNSKEFKDKVKDIVGDMSKETMKVILDGFNEGFKAFGKHMNVEKLLTSGLDNNQLWSALGKHAGEFFGQNLTDAITKSFANIDSGAFKGIESSLNKISGHVEKIAQKMGAGIEDVNNGIVEGTKEWNAGLEDAIKKYEQLKKLRSKTASSLSSARNRLSAIDDPYISDRLDAAVHTKEIEVINDGDAEKIRDAVDAFDAADIELQNMKSDAEMNLEVINRWIEAA